MVIRGIANSEQDSVCALLLFKFRAQCCDNCKCFEIQNTRAGIDKKQTSQPTLQQEGMRKNKIILPKFVLGRTLLPIILH